MIEKKNFLNDQQNLSVIEKHKRICVIAGPGCGKTRTLVGKIIHLIKNEKILGKKILVLTFAKKAAKEVKERIKKFGIKLDYNDNNDKGINIYNFHSLCYKIMKDNFKYLKKNEDDFLIYDRSDQEKVISEILAENMDKWEISSSSLLNYISNIKMKVFQEKNQDDDDILINWKEKIEEKIIDKLNKIHKLYEEKLSKNGAIDFNDILMFTIILFKNNPEIKNKYEKKFTHILLDEFQDVNFIQWKIIKMITNDNHNVFVVGDPNQAIYGFQGANPELIISLTKNKNWKTFYLKKNYRSSKNIVEVSNSFLKSNDDKMINNNLEAVRKEKGEVFFLNNFFFVYYIVKKIKWLIEEEKINPNQIAILYRNNYLSDDLEKILTNWKISYETLGSFNFIERREIKDIIMIIRSIIYKDDISLLEIMKFQGKLGGITIKKIKNFCLSENISVNEYLKTKEKKSEKIKILKKQNEAINKLIEKKKYLEKKLIITNNVNNFIKEIIFKFEYYDYLKNKYKKDWFRREKNIERFVIFSEDYEKKMNDVGDLKSKISIFLQWIIMNFEDRDLRGENNKNLRNVILSSIHQSKGLEFEIVFFIHLDEDVIPYKDTKNILEEKRLFYVGITRAKNKLYLVSKLKKTPFLNEINDIFLIKKNI